MILEALKYVAQGGPAVALVLVVWLFIRYLDRIHAAFMLVITNHIEHNTKSNNSMEKVLARLENLFEGWLSGRKD